MNLVMFGAPGSGKGTQCALLRCEHALFHLSTGDVLRSELGAGSELGRLAQKYIERGDLVPDDVILGIVEASLDRSEASAGFVLDGFPRTIEQAKALDATLIARVQPLDAVICLKIPTLALVRRLARRRICPSCGRISSIPPTAEQLALESVACESDGADLVRRADDEPAAIRHRLDVYLRMTAPVLDYYADRRMVIKINASLSVEDVHSRIQQRLGALVRRG